LFSTDNLFFLILFIVPGTVLLLFNRFLKPVPIAEKDETIRIAGALLFSFIVFGINSFVFSKDYKLFSAQDTIFADTTLLLKIVIVNVAVSFILSIVWAGFTKHLLHRINNMVNKVMNKPETTRNSTVWRDIFTDNFLGDTLDNCVIKVEQNGLISTGVLYSYSSPTSEKIEIILAYKTEIDEYFKFDAKQTDVSKKYFSVVLYEYIDLTNNFKITFYDMTKYRNNIKDAQGNKE